MEGRGEKAWQEAIHGRIWKAESVLIVTEKRVVFGCRESNQREGLEEKAAR